MLNKKECFKPYYKWNIFNTEYQTLPYTESVLGFKPYYKWNIFNTKNYLDRELSTEYSFKPYYKWNIFNTKVVDKVAEKDNKVF